MAGPMLAALTFATGAASAAMSHQAAKAQANAHNAENEQARKAFALEEALAQMDIARGQQQQYEADASEANDYASAALREWGEANALLGEGFAGNTGSRRLATVGIRQGQDMATLNSNSMRRRGELGFASMAASNSAQQKTASLRPADQPSKFGTALTIAGHGLTYAKTLNDLKGNSRTSRSSAD